MSATIPTQAAVVIPAYNTAATLGHCLDALLGQDIPLWLKLEIIVVDDGSTDQTGLIARRYPVHLLTTAHRGAAAARNAGVKAASPGCSAILFTDADCVAAPNWATSLLETLQQPTADKPIAGVKGVYRTKQRSLVARFVQAEFEERYARFVRRKTALDFADTYSAAYRRTILLEYPFDETLPGAIVEDAELGWRLRQAGYCFRFEPGAVVYHSHPAHLWAYFRRKFRIGRWRVSLYRRYPRHLSTDSHTSQAAKLQMLLLAGLTGSLILALFGKFVKISRWITKLANLSSFGFFAALQLSFGPFVWRAWQNDRSLALFALFMLPWRTLAFTTGALMGLADLVLNLVNLDE